MKSDAAYNGNGLRKDPDEGTRSYIKFVALADEVPAGDRDYAAEQLEAARRIWLSARNYTRVFLCHPSLDATSVVFYEIMQDLRAGETRGLSASFERLRYHLDSIAEMEHVSLGSIF